jgi:hypothetical protein
MLAAINLGRLLTLFEDLSSSESCPIRSSVAVHGRSVRTMRASATLGAERRRTLRLSVCTHSSATRPESS